MKSEKGITLLSLILYIILLMLVVSMLSVLNNLFFTNTKYLTNNSKSISEYNKFNMYFIEDIKKNTSADVTENTIEFEDGTLYTYIKEDMGIYRNKVKICNDIPYCTFSTNEQKVNNTKKQIIDVHLLVKSPSLFEASNSYVLKYW